MDQNMKQSSESTVPPRTGGSFPAARHNNQWVGSMGVSDEVAGVPGLSAQHLIALAKHCIKSLDDLADLASDELREVVGTENMTEKLADSVIMAARAHWFESWAKA